MKQTTITSSGAFVVGRKNYNQLTYTIDFSNGFIYDLKSMNSFVSDLNSFFKDLKFELINHFSYDNDLFLHCHSNENYTVEYMKSYLFGHLEDINLMLDKYPKFRYYISKRSLTINDAIYINKLLGKYDSKVLAIITDETYSLDNNGYVILNESINRKDKFDILMLLSLMEDNEIKSVKTHINSDYDVFYDRVIFRKEKP